MGRDKAKQIAEHLRQEQKRMRELMPLMKKAAEAAAHMPEPLPKPATIIEVEVKVKGAEPASPPDPGLLRPN